MTVSMIVHFKNQAINKKYCWYQFLRILNPESVSGIPNKIKNNNGDMKGYPTGYPSMMTIKYWPCSE